MTQIKSIPDQAAREQALNPEDSFIVQAPAGSGKTELLIQRYLKLLSMVKHPEEVLAITFTRKAAAEMQNRVLGAIERAADSRRPGKPHEAVTWELAREVRLRDDDEKWRLFEYPSRMRIMTIDSLCASLTRQMPVLSGFGAPSEITDDPAPLYERAARSAVAELESKSQWSDAVERLVRHLDNQLGRVEDLIAQMLPRRDQWLRHVVYTGDSTALRRMLEAAMSAVITETLSGLCERFPRACTEELGEICRFAATNLRETGTDSVIRHTGHLDGLPEARSEALDAWQGLAELLLTRSGQWRKTADKRIGFPAPSSAKSDAHRKALLEEKKEAFKRLLADLEGDGDLAEALDRVRHLPAPEYTDEQWAVLEALFEMLKLAVGHLEAVFEQAGKVDFAENAIRAKMALGGPQDPTDLALSMDYRISHILIDEFQDTSISQFDLIRALTAGWSPGDGRTFFAVGDPMQSIYGFREAEVGLFLKAWEEGIDAHLPLTPLTLKSNFRSDKGIVDWVNAAFAVVLPERGDAGTGAVPYTPAEAALDAGKEAPVSLHPSIDGEDSREAGEVVRCVTAALAEDPGGKVAILVRTRPHLKAIVPALHRAGLRFSAVEIDSLAERPVIRDLLALTRALCHPADRIAWLAVLRAPWCGLSLKDLYVLAGDDHCAAVHELINDENRVAAMSEDGRKRLLRVRPILNAAVEERERRRPRRRVESAWLALGGPAAVADPSELVDVPVYLDFIDAQLGTDMLTDIEAFEEGAFALFAMPDPGGDQRLQIMTIHKAKGLEFDTVIIPGLGRRPRGDDQALLLWQERPDAIPEEALLMAPISETGAEKDPTYHYLQKLKQAKQDHEIGRLLYVAATRAKKRLHLLGGAALDADGRVRAPYSRTLLNSLWPAVKADFEAAAAEQDVAGQPADGEASTAESVVVPAICRLPADWKRPAPPSNVSVAVGAGREIDMGGDAGMPEFDWAGVTVRHVGSVVHRWLRVICEEGLAKWGPERIADGKGRIEKDLMRTGVSPADMEDAAKQVMAALENAVTDEKGRWILAARASGACEYALSGVIDGVVVNAVIDRTFVDEAGVRWVIDYKSGVHRGGGLADFLSREQERYSAQMSRYARLLAEMENRPVRLGLYFPMIPGWRQWDPGNGASEV